MKSARYGMIAVCMTAILGCSHAYAETEFSEDLNNTMREGIEQYRAGAIDPNNYKLAIESFRRAYKIQPIPDALYNIARAYEKLNDCENALKAYREFALTSAENADAVKDYIADLTKQCGTPYGTLVLTCEPESTVLIIDGAAAASCTGEHKLEKKDHKLSFLADGYVAATRELSFDNSRTQVMKVVMDRERDEVRPTSRPVNRETASDERENSDSPQMLEVSNVAVSQSGGLSSQTPLFWGAVGTTGGGALFSIIGGALIGTAYRDGVKINTKVKEGLYQRNRGKLAWGGVLLGLGSAAVLSGLGMFIADVVLRDEDHSQAIRVVPGISVGPDGSSAVLTMQF